MVHKSFNIIAQSIDIHGPDNYPNGCKFSPDGLCVLTSSNKDSKLRVYNTFASETDLMDVGENADDSTCTAALPSASPTAASSLPSIRPWKSELCADGGDAVRCYDWYPTMRSDEPASCCFVATARSQPIHLYDAYSGLIRATYRAYNSLDELESAMVVSFQPSGQHFAAAGFRTADQRTIHIFDTAIPGRQSNTFLLGKTRRSSDGQKGMVSALAYGAARSGQQNLLAVGAYAPGSIYVYDQRAGIHRSGTVLENGHCVAGLKYTGMGGCSKRRRFDPSYDAQTFMTNKRDHNEHEPDKKVDDCAASTSWLLPAKSNWFQTRAHGGVTQLQFGNNIQDYILYSSSRRSNSILAWDLRMLSDRQDLAPQPCISYGLASYATDNDTNQRLQFDINETGDTLYAAGRDKCVRIYDTKTGALREIIEGLEDAVNGVSFGLMPSNPQRTHLAVTTGSRRFPSEDDLDSEIVQALSSNAAAGCIRLYQL
ncbi:hypothetical protein MPSEU_000522500 [Mayamaea pseudoterrestris]|nr:hypothetical protein MPSEU_000522500 [Mayamaea pseudoterrestris]